MSSRLEDVVWPYAPPLSSDDRNLFIREAVAALERVAELGEGVIQRTVGPIQARYLERVTGSTALSSKYSRGGANRRRRT